MLNPLSLHSHMVEGGKVISGASFMEALIGCTSNHHMGEWVSTCGFVGEVTFSLWHLEKG